MRNRHRKQKNPAATFPHELAKPGICQQIEIVRRLYSMGGFSGTNLPAEPPKPARDKAFHSQVRGGEEIQGWQGNRGLCSIRATVISLPNDPVTSLFSGAISSLAVRLSFLGRPSRGKTVMRTPKITVSAYTQLARRFNLRNNPMYEMTMRNSDRRENLLEETEF